MGRCPASRMFTRALSLLTIRPQCRNQDTTARGRSTSATGRLKERIHAKVAISPGLLNNHQECRMFHSSMALKPPLPGNFRMDGAVNIRGREFPGDQACVCFNPSVGLCFACMKATAQQFQSHWLAPERTRSSGELQEACTFSSLICNC